MIGYLPLKLLLHKEHWSVFWAENRESYSPLFAIDNALVISDDSLIGEVKMDWIVLDMIGEIGKDDKIMIFNTLRTDLSICLNQTLLKSSIIECMEI